MNLKNRTGQARFIGHKNKCEYLVTTRKTEERKMKRMPANRNNR